MNALEGEILCLREISINANKLLAALLLPVYLFIRFFHTDVVAIFLFIPPIIIFIFGACVYHFKNTISIFVTILSGCKLVGIVLCY